MCNQSWIFISFSRINFYWFKLPYIVATPVRATWQNSVQTDKWSNPWKYLFSMRKMYWSITCSWCAIDREVVLCSWSLHVNCKPNQTTMHGSVLQILMIYCRKLCNAMQTCGQFWKLSCVLQYLISQCNTCSSIDKIHLCLTVFIVAMQCNTMKGPILKIHYIWLLTKHEVKMAGYWLSSLFACLWTETESRAINLRKRGQYPATLTEKAWSIKDLWFGLKGNFSGETRQVIPSRQDSSILGSSCLLTELVT